MTSCGHRHSALSTVQNWTQLCLVTMLWSTWINHGPHPSCPCLQHAELPPTATWLCQPGEPSAQKDILQRASSHHQCDTAFSVPNLSLFCMESQSQRSQQSTTNAPTNARQAGIVPAQGDNASGAYPHHWSLIQSPVPHLPAQTDSDTPHNHHYSAMGYPGVNFVSGSHVNIVTATKFTKDFNLGPCLKEHFFKPHGDRSGGTT